MYGYFLWNHTDSINDCKAEEVELQHKLKFSDRVYFITQDGKPFMIMPSNSTEEEVISRIQEMTFEHKKIMTLEELQQKIDNLEQEVSEIRSKMITGVIENEISE